MNQQSNPESNPDRHDCIVMLIAFTIFALLALSLNAVSFQFNLPSESILYQAHSAPEFFALEPVKEKKVAHKETPDSVRALYMTSWVAATPKIRTRIVDLLDKTEANAVVIDIKDDTGRIAFLPKNEWLLELGAGVNRITDIDEFIDDLHTHDVYVIGRVSVFQDPHLVKMRPGLAVRRVSDGGVWQDRKGLTWIDAGASEAWDYVIAIAKEAHSRGFDEINFDYIRYPTDGNMEDIVFTHAGNRPRQNVIGEFFAYLSYSLQGEDFKISADLFGMTTTELGDMGIGQVLESALKYFDYVAPMVYPSHFGPGVYGVSDPASQPYAIVYHAMSVAALRATAASTTPLKLRPWLQDFDLGAVYTADLVRAQMQATYDAGLTSWMMWDPSNRYTRAAYLNE
ncbi:MAG: putative glycoside hydrolase [bacterium]|nr:putative glycoside hydrolase [bacterium]